MAAAGSSRFAATCELLRQYMREQNQRQQQQQQQGGGLAGVFGLPAAEVADARTMQLFPTRVAGASPPPQERAEAQGQQQAARATLTIFYGGRVLAFEDFPADKAKELMQMARSASPQAPPEKGAPDAAVPPEALTDLPLARKASLQRFLEKRKHRITANNLYRRVPAHEDVAGGKPMEDEPGASWLGL
ncbi:hypothetical protein ACP70R_021149 [Stipagrostis hirtigluma subsp. patula]